MLDIGFVLLLTAISALFGLRVVALFSPGHDQFENWALAIPVGLGALSLALLGLAEVGLLTRPAMASVLVCLFAIGLSGREARGSLRDLTQRMPMILSKPRIDHFFSIAILFIALGSLLTALAPVTDGDALCYHLLVPKLFLESHSARFEPDLHETIYPLGTEMLDALALGFRGPVACRLISWIFGLSLAANVGALARPVLATRWPWASAVALGVPAISNGMGAPLNDVALAAFGNAALVAYFRWKNQPNSGSAILLGLLAGMAIGVKYPALVWSGLLGLAMLVIRPDRQADKPNLLSHLLLFVFTSLLIGGPWYLRAFLHTGNPVFPFFRSVFGAGIDDVLDPIKRPMTVNSWNLTTAIGPMSLDPDRFDSVSHQFGPAFLLFLPGFFLLRPPIRLVQMVSLAWLFLTLCITQRQSMRFVLIAVGPLSVAVAWVASVWWNRPTMPARALVGILILLIAAESAIALARSRHGLAVILGIESEAAYLDRREPTYRVGCWVSEHLPPTARIIGQDHRGFYFPRPYTMELAHRRRTGLGRHGETAEDVITHLRAEGFTHLLFAPPIPESAVEFDPTLGRLLKPWLKTHSPIFEQKIADGDGVVRLYSIYALDGGARP